MSTDKRVTAIFEDRKKAMDAISALESMGYGKSKVSLLVAENSWGPENIKIEQNTKVPEGVAIGAGAGSATGALAAGLTAVGTIAATGGVGLLATGPLVAALAGAGAGGAAGGIIGGLIGLGVDETEAKYVESELGKGHVMIGVDCKSDNTDEIKSVFENRQASNVSLH